MLDFSDQQAIFLIVSKLTPFLYAAEVDTCLVLCALYLGSIPQEDNVERIQQLIVALVAGL